MNPIAGGVREDVCGDVHESFAASAIDFLDALADVYPDCQATRSTREQLMVTCGARAPEALRRTAQKRLATEYARIMTPHLSKPVDDALVAELSDLPMLSSMRLSDKWREADAETRECIAEYVAILNKYASVETVISAVPQQLFDRVSQAVATSMRDGGQPDIMGIASDIAGDIDPATLENSFDPRQLRSILAGLGGVPGAR